MPEDTIPLRRFFEAVEERLSACSADELRSILRAMAQVVAPKDRQGFLEALVPGKEARDVIQSALRQDDLLSEIDDLVAEIRAEMDSAEDAYDRYGGHWDDEDSLGPYEQFIAPLAELFDRTAGVFDCDNRSLARDAYRKLFDGLAMEDDYGRGVRASDLRDADIRGARGRYLRALYEIEAPANRPERLFEAMQDFGDLLGDGPVMLEDLIRVSDRPLPDREPFLRAWIAFLREQEGASADRWLREAIRLLEGTKCNEIRCQRTKSGVGSSFLPRTNSGVGSSFLPEKVSRHRVTRRHRITRRITRKDELTQGYPDTGLPRHRNSLDTGIPSTPEFPRHRNSPAKRCPDTGIHYGFDNGSLRCRTVDIRSFAIR